MDRAQHRPDRSECAKCAIFGLDCLISAEFVALTVFFVALTVLFEAVTVLFVALTVLFVALTVLFAAGGDLIVEDAHENVIGGVDVLRARQPFLCEV